MRNSSPITKNRPISLRRLLKASGVKLLFVVEAFADVKATEGFIRILGIAPEQVIVRHNGQVARRLVEQSLPGVSITGRAEPRRCLVIRFHDSSPLHLRGSTLIVNPDPYKYFSPVSAPRKEGPLLRKAMGVEEGRKVIALLSPRPQEVRQVLRAYEKVRLPKRPLLIIGLREPDRSLKQALAEKGFRVLSRERRGRGLSSWGRNDIVLLNTMGELPHFLKAVDLAVVGYDRNLFEPMALEIPILYFGEPPGMSPQAERLMTWFRLFWLRNSTIKDLLDKTWGGRPVVRGRLHRQMESALLDPLPLIRGTRECVQRLHREVLPEVRRRADALLTSALKNLDSRAA